MLVLLSRDHFTKCSLVLCEPVIENPFTGSPSVHSRDGWFCRRRGRATRRIRCSRQSSSTIQLWSQACHDARCWHPLTTRPQQYWAEALSAVNAGPGFQAPLTLSKTRKTPTFRTIYHLLLFGLNENNAWEVCNSAPEAAPSTSARTTDPFDEISSARASLVRYAKAENSRRLPGQSFVMDIASPWFRKMPRYTARLQAHRFHGTLQATSSRHTSHYARGPATRPTRVRIYVGRQTSATVPNSGRWMITCVGAVLAVFCKACR